MQCRRDLASAVGSSPPAAAQAARAASRWQRAGRVRVAATMPAGVATTLSQSDATPRSPLPTHAACCSTRAATSRRVLGPGKLSEYHRHAAVTRVGPRPLTKAHCMAARMALLSTWHIASHRPGSPAWRGSASRTHQAAATSDGPPPGCRCCTARRSNATCAWLSSPGDCAPALSSSRRTAHSTASTRAESRLASALPSPLGLASHAAAARTAVHATWCHASRASSSASRQRHQRRASWAQRAPHLGLCPALAASFSRTRDASQPAWLPP